MKKSLLIAVLVTLPLFSPLAWADESHHSDKDKKPAVTMTDKDKQMQMGKMQESMLRMHEHMHKIMNAKTPQERKRLKQQHSKMMHDMPMMQGMEGDHGMMGTETKGGKMNDSMKGM